MRVHKQSPDLVPAAPTTIVDGSHRRLLTEAHWGVWMYFFRHMPCWLAVNINAGFSHFDSSCSFMRRARTKPECVLVRCSDDQTVSEIQTNRNQNRQFRSKWPTPGAPRSFKSVIFANLGPKVGITYILGARGCSSSHAELSRHGPQWPDLGASLGNLTNDICFQHPPNVPR